MLNKFKKFIEKVRFKHKLRVMDDFYHFTGQSSYSMFPPSFYYTHTPEEIERITQEEMKKIRELIDQMEPSDSQSAPIYDIIERYNTDKTLDES